MSRVVSRPCVARAQDLRAVAPKVTGSTPVGHPTPHSRMPANPGQDRTRRDSVLSRILSRATVDSVLPTDTLRLPSPQCARPRSR